MNHSFMIGRGLSVALCMVPLSLAAADLSSGTDEGLRVAGRAPDPGMCIALSPDAAIKADQKVRLELYRRNVSGDAAAQKSWQSLQSAKRVATLADLAMTKESTPARTRAIHDLARLDPSDDPDASGLGALAAVAVADADGSTRDLARTGVVARNDERVIKPLVRALLHQDELIKANAAAVLKAVGGPRVFEVIIEHWKEVWGAGPRSHVFFGHQRSYISDYDVSGSAFDPVVSSFMTGVVLDSKVLRIEGDRYKVTIREIAPDELKDARMGNDPKAWQKWLADKKDALAKDGEKKRVEAVEALEKDKKE
jgi:hypothetical protein